MESHYLFAHHFCRVGRGNEKGHVENHVGYARRNLLVPVPSFASWAALNEYLAGPDAPSPFPHGGQVFRIRREIFTLDGTPVSKETA